MRSRLIPSTPLCTLLSGVALLALAAPLARAEHPPRVTPPGCPSPYFPAPGTPPSAKPAPGEGEARPEQPPTDFGPELASAQGPADPGNIGLAAPNMIGNLLNASRSIRFGFTRTAGNANFLGLASTTILNASVADNNSPIPNDRIYFRYNFFHNALSVTGISAQTAPFAPGVVTQLPQIRDYDVHQYMFGGEKTFFDGLMSVELRVPFRRTLAFDNTLSVGDITGPAPGFDSAGNPFFNTVITPQNSVGREDTQFGDLTLIFKGLIHQSRALAVSLGLATTIPTAPDTRVRVIDFASTGLDSNGNPTRLNSGQRERSFRIQNETWALTPFVAALVTPSDRLFAQGFLSFDFPVGDSDIIYTDRFLRGRFGAGGNPALQAALAAGRNMAQPFGVTRDIGEQTLMHLDIGTGFWLLRDRSARWLTGLAPTLELHYTTTLSNAEVVALPGGLNLQVDPNNPTGPFIPERGPQVGSDRGRVDILDLTVGTTFEFANRATLATGFTFPLRNGDNRTFDWEFQLQLNFYFGGPRGRTAPNLF